jgi:pyruvate dehydrogenase E1 component alpha subunit
MDNMAIAAEPAYRRILDIDGSVVGPVPDLAPERLVGMYRWMVLARSYDERALALQRQGRIGTYSPLRGQEAAQIGMALALDPEDWIFPTYRDIAACFVHGLPMERGFLYGQGVGEGLVIPDSVHVWPRSISIASHVPHAVGMAWGFKLQGRRAVVVASFGDGATSKGDFHEAANFAGVLAVPVVFYVQNNQYAISVPRARQTAAASIAVKAVAYGFEGIRVDGNDILAVWSTVRAAVERARQGGGPTLIEAETYRLGAHTTADDPTRYRSPEEVAYWQERDPLIRFRRFLEAQRLWSVADEDALWQECRRTVDEAWQRAEALAEARPADVFRHAWANPPERVRAQANRILGGA